jgi:hypothetical protein
MMGFFEKYYNDFVKNEASICVLVSIINVMNPVDARLAIASESQ